VLVLLAELAVAPVALDQLLLAGDLLGLRVDVLDRSRVAFHALSVMRRNARSPSMIVASVGPSTRSDGRSPVPGSGGHPCGT
jgi:hypothetical protein